MSISKKTNQSLIKRVSFWIILVLVFLAALATFISINRHNPLVVDWGSFLGGSLAYLGTVILGAVSVWQNDKQRIENREAQERIEAINDALMKQNKELNERSIEDSVRPYIAVTLVRQNNRKIKIEPIEQLGDNKPPEEQNSASNASDDKLFYSESFDDNFYFVITSENVRGFYKEPPEIRDYKGSDYPPQSIALIKSLFNTERCFLLARIDNVGEGCAIALQVALFQKGMQDDFDQSKHFNPLTLSANSGKRVEMLLDSNVSEKVEYCLSFRYMNIFGKRYEQNFPFSKRQFDFSYNQIVINEDDQSEK